MQIREFIAVLMLEPEAESGAALDAQLAAQPGAGELHYRRALAAIQERTFKRVSADAAVRGVMCVSSES